MTSLTPVLAHAYYSLAIEDEIPSRMLAVSRIGIRDWFCFKIIFGGWEIGKPASRAFRPSVTVLDQASKAVNSPKEDNVTDSSIALLSPTAVQQVLAQIQSFRAQPRLLSSLKYESPKTIARKKTIYQRLLKRL